MLRLSSGDFTAVSASAMVRAPKPMHGKISQISHHAEGLFASLPSPFRATRYHSLMVEPAGLPAELEITAESEDGVIQGLRHRQLPIYGVQFHPESIETEHGMRIIGNFLDLAHRRDTSHVGSGGNA